MQQELRQAKPSRAGPGTGRAALAAAAVIFSIVFAMGGLAVTLE